MKNRLILALALSIVLVANMAIAYAAPDDSQIQQGFSEFEELKKKWLDKQQGSSRPEVPDVEMPDGSDRTAQDVFGDIYGDMWNSPEWQLDKESKMPEEEFFDTYLDGFREEQMDIFNQISEHNSEQMSNAKQKDLFEQYNPMKAMKQYKAEGKMTMLSGEVFSTDDFKNMSKKMVAKPSEHGWMSSKAREMQEWQHLDGDGQFRGVAKSMWSELLWFAQPIHTKETRQQEHYIKEIKKYESNGQEPPQELVKKYKSSIKRESDIFKIIDMDEGKLGGGS